MKRKKKPRPVSKREFSDYMRKNHGPRASPEWRKEHKAEIDAAMLEAACIVLNHPEGISVEDLLAQLTGKADG